MQNAKTSSAIDLDRARTLTWSDLRGLLSERTEMILRSLGGVAGSASGLGGDLIDTRVFVRSIAPHLRMN